MINAIVDTSLAPSHPHTRLGLAFELHTTHFLSDPNKTDSTEDIDRRKNTTLKLVVEERSMRGANKDGDLVLHKRGQDKKQIHKTHPCTHLEPVKL